MATPARDRAGSRDGRGATSASSEPALPRSGSATSRSPTRPAADRCSTTSTSRSRPGRRWRSSGRTAPARPPSPSSSAASTTPTPARSRSTASTSATSTSTHWRAHLAAVFQDFVRYELTSARQRRTPRRRRRTSSSRRSTRPVPSTWPTSTRPLAKGYPGGVDLSGGQWQRVALARAIAKVGAGATVVLLDEPTAMLDVRGESEIFRRVLGATSRGDHDPGLPPVLDRPTGRPDLRRRARARDRARQPRRADGARAGATTRCTTSRPAASTTSGSSTSTGRRSCMSRFDEGTAEATGEDTAGEMPAGAAVDGPRRQARLPRRAAAAAGRRWR